jgi:hypothetical protein
MRLAPLVLSVSESGRTGGSAQRSCPFCGVRLAEGREPILCPDGSRDNCCVSCHLVRHLERDTIADEAVLIWFPELTQAALNALAHAAHRRLARDGALHLAASPFLAVHDDAGNGALEAIRALAALSAEAEARLGTSSPRALAAALLRMKPKAYANRAEALGGLRLWPRGRFLVDGEDVYPRLIAGRASGLTEG